MCGIAGIYCYSQEAVTIAKKQENFTPGKEYPGKNSGSYKQNAVNAILLKNMTDAIKHRGPDDEGYLLKDRKGIQVFAGGDSPADIKSLYPILYNNDEGAIRTSLNAAVNSINVDDFILGMGFQRLSILELKPIGHQPMWDKELGIVICYNGEIYNYLELREELKAKGYIFFSHSDTEVIIKAYHYWGEDCVQHFNGMWAFSLWDERKKVLFCSRDRYGIKPFYYAVQDGVIYWGSEIKQLLLTPVDKTLNQAMIWRSMKINSLLVYDDETYWQHINCLKPGHNLLLTNGKINIKQYYDLDIANLESSKLSYNEAVEQYRSIFLDSIGLQLRSDVEIGATLSGGMDSSAIVCSAVHKKGEPLKTFSSYYAFLPELDERSWIEKIVQKTSCRSFYVSPKAEDAIQGWENLTYYNDFPLAAGFVSQNAVMQEAHRQGIKVLLSGQGSDEISAGYRHSLYRYFADLLRGMQIGKLGKELPRYLQKEKPVLSKLGKILLSTFLPESALYNLEFRYYRFEPFNSAFTREADKNCGEQILKKIADIKASRLSNFLYNMMHNTSLQTLLHFEDRMAMANSVESRVPFLDNRLVDFVFSLPSAYKVKPPYTKVVHRSAMQELIPEEIYRRQDKGIFSSPFYQVWMKNELKPFITEILTSKTLRERGIWNLPKINFYWHKYLAGDNSQAEMLFNIIALEIWFRQFVD
ncbi:MAG TPA: asparagine synthase (glutamine-hydrolyzing) [Candidatus Cloacimonas sp.]|jgi:asparagine synthase (glutamine-hydrolysing)|nr:asparagine synthase (glutamine-hydrolyzing) [Candidatus Cloacimonas sp.]HPS59737.1 asparagine synthase (glutamine-hydrolyzing) [Candidatus Cloacimonas sp.]